MAVTSIEADERDREIASAGMLAMLFSEQPFDFYFDQEFDKNFGSNIFHFSGWVGGYNGERESTDLDAARAAFDAVFENYETRSNG